ncbi:MAG: hypothetical protein OXF93_01570 [Acidobacteria bacterium]|nr:hypothetical protein [Acidobacteriota bacterium]
MTSRRLLVLSTVDDATSFTRSFTAAIPMKRGAAPLFEYACHEGNDGLFNLLSGARAKERETDEQ